MERSISNKNKVNYPIVNNYVKPLHEDKYLGIDSSIRFFGIKDGDNTEKGEYA